MIALGIAAELAIACAPAGQPSLFIPQPIAENVPTVDLPTRVRQEATATVAYQTGKDQQSSEVSDSHEITFGIPGRLNVGLANSFYLPSGKAEIPFRAAVQFSDTMVDGKLLPSRVASISYAGNIGRVQENIAAFADEGVPIFIVIDMGVTGELRNIPPETFREYTKEIGKLFPFHNIYFIFGNEINVPESIYRNQQELDWYINMYQKGIEGIRRSNPSAKFVPPGDAYYGDKDQLADVLKPFLEKAKEKNLPVDAVDAHVHSTKITEVIRRALQYRDLLDQMGMDTIPLYINEIGLPPSLYEYPEDKKANWAAGVIAAGTTAMDRDLIKGFTLYSAAEWIPARSFSKLVDGEFHTTPAYDAFIHARQMFYQNTQFLGMDEDGEVGFLSETMEGVPFEFIYNQGEDNFLIPVDESRRYEDVYGKLFRQMTRDHEYVVLEPDTGVYIFQK